MDDNDDDNSSFHGQQEEDHPQEPNPVAAALEDSISVDGVVNDDDAVEQDTDNADANTVTTTDAVVVTTADDAQATLDKFSETLHGQQYRRLREERLYQANSNLTLETAPSQPNPLAATVEEGGEAKDDDSDQKLAATATGAAELKQEIQLSDTADAAAPPKTKKHQRKRGRVSASYGSRTTIVETGQKRRSCICAHPRCNEIMTKWAKCSPSSYHYVQLPKLAGVDSNGNPTRSISDTELYKNQFRLATLRYLKVKNPLPKDERIAVLHYRE